MWVLYRVLRLYDVSLVLYKLLTLEIQNFIESKSSCLKVHQVWTKSNIEKRDILTTRCTTDWYLLAQMHIGDRLKYRNASWLPSGKVFLLSFVKPYLRNVRHPFSIFRLTNISGIVDAATWVVWKFTFQKPSVYALRFQLFHLEAMFYCIFT